MYKVVRTARLTGEEQRKDFRFDRRTDAEEFFTRESERPEVVDISLFCCLPFRDDVELTRFVRSL